METETGESGGRKRKHSDCRTRSSPSDSDREVACRTCYCKTPLCTSAWDLHSLEMLSVFYEASSCTLTDIMVKADLFPELTAHLQRMLTMLKDSFNFDVEMERLIKMKAKDFRQEFVSLLERAKRSIIESAQASENLHLIVKPVLDFLDDAAYMVVKARCRKETEGIFKQFFSSFVSMCQLSPKIGDVCRRTGSIKGVEVSSCPDLRIKCTDERHVNLTENEMAIVVSIFEEKKPYGADNGGPGIYQNLDIASLGQHGGQLLLEWNLCSIKNRYMFGIIGAGTKHMPSRANRRPVYLTSLSWDPGRLTSTPAPPSSQIYFTLLDINGRHMAKIHANKDLDKEEKAKIFYTEAFDILKKNDRDILMETFLRLSLN